MNIRNLLILIWAHITLGSIAPMMVLLNGFVGSTLAPSESLATFGMGMLVAGTAVSTIPAAKIANRYGRRVGFLAAVLISVFGCLSCVASLYVRSFVLYCAGMTLLGCTLAFVQQFRFAATENVPAAKTSLAVGLILFAGIGAAMVGPRLGVFTQHMVPDIPYAGSYLALAGLALLAAGGLMLYRPQIKPQEQTFKNRVKFSSLWTSRYALGVLCGTTAYTVMSLVMTATPISMHHHQGIAMGDTANVIQWHIAAMFLPSLFVGVLMQKWGAPKVALFGLICNLMAVVLALQGVTYLHYMVALVLLGLGWNGLFLAGTQLVATAYPGAERYQAQAGNDFIIFGFQGAASLSAGLLMATLGWNGLNLVALALLLICLIGWLHLVLIKGLDSNQSIA